jgi:hypothetical protein
VAPRSATGLTKIPLLFAQVEALAVLLVAAPAASTGEKWLELLFETSHGTNVSIGAWGVQPAGRSSEIKQRLQNSRELAWDVLIRHVGVAHDILQIFRNLSDVVRGPHHPTCHGAII